MEPVFDNALLALIATYGELREEPSSRSRTEQLGNLVVDLLGRSGIDAVLRLRDEPVVVFSHDGHQSLIGLTWAEREMTGSEAVEAAQLVRADSSGGTVILLSMSGFGPQTAGWFRGAGSSGTLLWDRTHLDAVLCGLESVQDLVAASTRHAFVHGAPYSPLANLLSAAGSDACPRMVTPDLRQPPWPILKEPYTGIPAQLVLVGEDGWDLPSGIAALDSERLVVVTAGGLVELDARRGTTAWMMRVADCVDEPLVSSDGSVLAVCGNAVILVGDGTLEAVAGGFTGKVHLLAGPEGEPWVLSGIGPTFGSDQGTLALTRLGSRVGEQHRHDIHFGDNVHTAAWLDQRQFWGCPALTDRVGVVVRLLER